MCCVCTDEDTVGPIWYGSRVGSVVRRETGTAAPPPPAAAAAATVAGLLSLFRFPIKIATIPHEIAQRHK